MGHNELVKECRGALASEEKHLLSVRGRLEGLLMAQANA